MRRDLVLLLRRSRRASRRKHQGPFGCGYIWTWTVQLTTDGHLSYLKAVDRAFKGGVDYADASEDLRPRSGAERRYSPPVCSVTEQRIVQGALAGWPLSSSCSEGS
jgi:hypothetical protein